MHCTRSTLEKNIHSVKICKNFSVSCSCFPDYYFDVGRTTAEALLRQAPWAFYYLIKQ